MFVAKQFKLSRSKTLSLLDELEAASGDAKSLYFPPGLTETDIETSLKGLVNINVSKEIAPLVLRSETGAVLFWSAQRICLILPPFPVTEKLFTIGNKVEPVRSMLKQQLTIALVLVRLGAYAVGVCQGERLVASKVGTGLVHARHRQGGSSSARFARHREKQTEYFLGRVCEHAREKLEPYARFVNYIAYGGARTTILSLQKRCPFLGQFDSRKLPPLLTIPDPRQAVLEAAVNDVWSSHVTEWREQDSSCY
ncbi:MAG: hypothetical protein HYX79_09625 [Chloroflexi bacterium]|nr:hypothetical protein [Chloroflexota bacterium]